MGAGEAGGGGERVGGRGCRQAGCVVSLSGRGGSARMFLVQMPLSFRDPLSTALAGCLTSEQAWRGTYKASLVPLGPIFIAAFWFLKTFSAKLCDGGEGTRTGESMTVSAGFSTRQRAADFNIGVWQALREDGS